MIVLIYLHKTRVFLITQLWEAQANQNEKDKSTFKICIYRIDNMSDDNVCSKMLPGGVLLLERQIYDQLGSHRLSD